jgi:hypothetical protein
MKHDYTDQPSLMEYMEEYQYPQRKELGAAWTCKIRHYGNNTNSPCEGMHALLKSFLHSSTGDLLRVSCRYIYLI